MGNNIVFVFLELRARLDHADHCLKASNDEFSSPACEFMEEAAEQMHTVYHRHTDNICKSGTYKSCKSVNI